MSPGPRTLLQHAPPRLPPPGQALEAGTAAERQTIVRAGQKTLKLPPSLEFKLTSWERQAMTQLVASNKDGSDHGVTSVPHHDEVQQRSCLGEAQQQQHPPRLPRVSPLHVARHESRLQQHLRADPTSHGSQHCEPLTGPRHESGEGSALDSVFSLQSMIGRASLATVQTRAAQHRWLLLVEGGSAGGRCARCMACLRSCDDRGQGGDRGP